MKTKKEIIDFINEQLSKSNRKYYSDFYIGITDDVQRRLFQEHNVSEKRDWWVFCTAASDAVAREVEQYYQDKGMRGEPGGGKPNSRIVYCYAVTSSTIE